MAQSESDVTFKIADKFYSQGLKFEKAMQWNAAEKSFEQAAQAAQKIGCSNNEEKIRLAQYLYHLALAYKHQEKEAQQLLTIEEINGVLKSVVTIADKGKRPNEDIDNDTLTVILFQKIAAKMYLDAQKLDDARRLYQLALSGYSQLITLDDAKIMHLAYIYNGLAELKRPLTPNGNPLEFSLYDTGRVIYSESPPAGYDILVKLCNLDDTIMAQKNVDADLLRQYCDFMSLLLTVVDTKQFPSRQMKSALSKTQARTTLDDIFANWSFRLADLHTAATAATSANYAAGAATRLSTAAAILDDLNARTARAPEDRTLLLRRAVTRSMSASLSPENPETNAGKRKLPISPPLTESLGTEPVAKKAKAAEEGPAGRLTRRR